MKAASLYATLALAFFLQVVVTSPAYACNNETLKGPYAFTLRGTILTGPAAGIVDGVAMTTFDGAGGLRQVDAVSHNGSVAAVWRPGTGSYTINPDCTGSMSIDSPGSPTLNLAIVIGKSGRTIHTVVLNDGFSITSDAERVRIPCPRAVR
jgi:hypothetical protein